jgi:hypothetical protein
VRSGAGTGTFTSTGDPVDTLTRGDVVEVKVLLASVALALAELGRRASS